MTDAEIQAELLKHLRKRRRTSRSAAERARKRPPVVYRAAQKRHDEYVRWVDLVERLGPTERSEDDERR